MHRHENGARPLAVGHPRDGHGLALAGLYAGEPPVGDPQRLRVGGVHLDVGLGRVTAQFRR